MGTEEPVPAVACPPWHACRGMPAVLCAGGVGASLHSRGGKPFSQAVVWATRQTASPAHTLCCVLANSTLHSDEEWSLGLHEPWQNDAVGLARVYFAQDVEDEGDLQSGQQGVAGGESALTRFVLNSDRLRALADFLFSRVLHLPDYAVFPMHAGLNAVAAFRKVWPVLPPGNEQATAREVMSKLARSLACKRVGSGEVVSNTLSCALHWVQVILRGPELRCTDSALLGFEVTPLAEAIHGVVMAAYSTVNYNGDEGQEAGSDETTTTSDQLADGKLQASALDHSTSTASLLFKPSVPLCKAADYRIHVVAVHAVNKRMRALLNTTCSMTHRSALVRETCIRAHLAAPEGALVDEFSTHNPRVCLNTSRGQILLEVHPQWAPRGAHRFMEMVRADGYMSDMRFFRVIPGFAAQFGLPAAPSPDDPFVNNYLSDDSHVRVTGRGSNARGMVSFAAHGPKTRGTQIYINLRDNFWLDSYVYIYSHGPRVDAAWFLPRCPVPMGTEH